MHRILAPFVLALCLAAPASADQRALSGFSAIWASGKFRVEASVGDSYSVRVDGRDAADVVTTVNDGALRISQRGTYWFGGAPELDAVVHVTAPSYDSFAAQRGAEMRVQGPVSAQEMSLSAIQGGALRIEDLRADQLNARASQGGAVDARGQCGVVRANASMGGALNAEGVECERAEVSASMGGVASVFARETVDANATMGGAIDVSGDPTRNDTSAIMGGAISIN
ncbi:MAG: DUF2807 domain-containing protein [Hyphomonadaceae bacterium]